MFEIVDTFRFPQVRTEYLKKVKHSVSKYNATHLQ